MVATNKLAAVMAEVVGGGGTGVAAGGFNAGSRKHLFRDKARVTQQMIYLLSKAAS